MKNKPQPKKEWTKPELTVLVRNKPEEQVLTNCKGSIPGDPNNVDGNCNDAPNGCTECSYRTAS